MSVTLELYQTLIKNEFATFPPIQAEYEYDQLDNPPPYGKFMKPYQRNMNSFSKLWKKQLEILNQFNDFQYLYNTCFTDTGFYSLMKMYAKIDLDLKDFNKMLKSESDQVVKEYYTSRFNDFLTLNIFDYMKDDFEQYHPKAKERYVEYDNQYGDHFNVFHMAIPDYLKDYKDTIKAEKEAREQMKKKQK